MSNNITIPEPENSGSDGRQVEADSTSELIEAKPWEGLPMAKAIEGLAASNNRAFGGEVASALIAGATTQLALELQYSKAEILKLRETNDSLRDQLSKADTKKAVLEERIDAFRNNRHLRNIGIFIGTTLLAAGIKLFDINQSKYGYASLLFGALLLITCWYSAPRGGKK